MPTAGCDHFRVPARAGACVIWRSGNIDGFCVGEPWNSVAVEEGFRLVPCDECSRLLSGYPREGAG